MKKYLISIIIVIFSFALLSCGGLFPVKKGDKSPPPTPTLDDTLWVDINTANPALDTPKKAFLSGRMGVNIAFFYQGKSCYDTIELMTATQFAPVFNTPIPPANYTLTYLRQCGVTDTPLHKESYTLDLHGGSTLAGATGTISTNTTFTISSDGLTMDAISAGNHRVLIRAVPSPPLS